jgi:hypothetical protein
MTVTLARQQKITLGEMRASGVRGLLIYCSDFRCSHSTAISGDRWPDDVRLNPFGSWLCTVGLLLAMLRRCAKPSVCNGIRW